MAAAGAQEVFDKFAEAAELCAAAADPQQLWCRDAALQGISGRIQQEMG